MTTFRKYRRMTKEEQEATGYPTGSESINDDEQFHLKLMRELTINGLSLRQIAQHLNNSKIFNMTGPWNHVSIKRVMK